MSSHLQPRRSWEFRPALASDVGGLVALHQRVFDRTISREHWIWKLGARGPGANVWIAEKGGRPIFQYAGIPVRFRHFGSDCWAMIDVDTMTDPDFRRQGLLTQGAAKAYADWKNVGFAFSVGLPNEQWGSRAAALGWARVGILRWWVRWLDPVRMIAARLALPWAKAPRTSAGDRDHGFDTAPVLQSEQIGELWNLIEQDGVVRDSSWFRWRYLGGVPKWNVVGAWQSGRLAGAAAFHLDGNRECLSGIIGEVVGTRFQGLRVLLRRCCNDLRALGAVRVAMLIHPGTRLEEAALATGFLPRRASFSVEAVDLGGGLPLTAHFQGGDFDTV